MAGEQVAVAATPYLDRTDPPAVHSRRRGTCASPIARHWARATELAPPAIPRPPWRKQLQLTAVNAWHWLSHSVRVALAASGDIERSPAADPTAVRALIRRTRVALVTTRDRAGALHSEPMEASNREFDGELWFAASESAEILDRVRARAAVQVTYLDDQSNRCVVLDGVARVCGDAGRNGLPTLIRIDIMSADIWE